MSPKQDHCSSTLCLAVLADGTMEEAVVELAASLIVSPGQGHPGMAPCSCTASQLQDPGTNQPG